MMRYKYDIWFAWVDFEEDASQSKKRPVLLLEDGSAYLLSAKITSHAPRSQDWGEYAIRDWREAGLLKPSTVRLSKLSRLSEGDFIRKLGSLSEYDRAAVAEWMGNPKDGE